MTSSVRRRLGAVACAATLVAALAACNGDADPASSPTSSDSPAPTDTATEDPTSSPSPTESETAGETEGTTVPVYFVTDSGAGPRLVREFHRVDGSAPLAEAARLVAGGGEPNDPDYRTLWPEVEISGATATDGVIRVEVPGDGFTTRPDGMSRREARLAVQQLVYTLQGVQQARVPVVISRSGGTETLFDLRTDGQLTQASPLRTLNLVNVTSPEEGRSVTGEAVTVSGVANSFEANVICELRRGEETLQTVPITAEGWMEDRLFPFAGEISLTDVEPGEAELHCSTDDPSGGQEGFGPFIDTKTITIG